MRVVYISGPYTAPTIRGVVKNIRAAEEAALKFWQRGDAVICPHMNTALLDGSIDYETIMQGDLELVRRSDVIAMLPRWTFSPGATREHDIAQELGKKVIYL